MATRRWVPSTRPSTNGDSSAYDAELAELREQASDARGRGRLAAAPAAGRAQAGAHARGAAARDQGPARPGGLAEREAHLHPARGARAHRRAPRGGRQAHPAAVGLRHAASARNDDGTVDVFSGGRKMRVSRAPRPRPATSSSAAPRSCSTSRSTSCWPAAPSCTGEVVTFKELLDDGHRAMIVGRADEERVVELADAPHGREAPRRRHRADGPARRACCSRSCPGPRSRSSCSRRCPTSPTTTSAASTARSSRSPTRSSCRSCTRSCSPSTSCRRPRASCSTARPAAARRSSPRRSPTRWPRRWPRSAATSTARSYFLNIKGPELLNKYVGETERQIRLVFQRAREKTEEGWPVIVFFDEMDSLFRTRGTGISSDMESTIVPAAAGRDRRRRDAEERDRHRRLQPRGPHRPGHPAARAAST